MGDVPSSAYYHADLLGAPLFVTTSDHIVSGSTADKLHYGLRGHMRSRVRMAVDRSLRSDTITPVVLQDGHDAWAFRRLRGTGYNAPNLGSLNYQLSLIDFAKLNQDGECVIVYQHLGVLDRVASRCRSATINDVARRPDLLAGLRLLASEAEHGRTWVPGLQRLLDYKLMMRTTSVLLADDGVNFRLLSSLDVSRPSSFFGGLTIFVHPSTQASVWYKDFELPVTQNGPDETGRYSITIEAEPKQNIWT